MTPEQIKLVQTSFARVFPLKARMAQGFYDRLFEIAPGVRPLFPENMTQQREKLADSLVFVVKNLDAPEHLALTVAGLARRHAKYGARPEHFGPVGEALIHALDAHSPKPLTDQEKEAWTQAYTTIVNAMLPAMEEAAA